MWNLHSTNFFHLLFFTFLKVRAKSNLDNIPWTEGVESNKFSKQNKFKYETINKNFYQALN